MKVMSWILVATTFGVVCCTPKKNSNSAPKYYGTDSQKATLSFHGQVKFAADRSASESKRQSLALEAIESQAQFLFGALKEHQGNPEDGSIDFTKTPGIPNVSHVIKIVELVRVNEGAATSSSDQWLVSYDFTDQVAFSKEFLANGERNFKIRLPVDPKTIYAFGLASREDAMKKTWNLGADQTTISNLAPQASINLCTDFHYNSSGDFWYFWNPYKENCPSIVMDQTLLIDALIKPSVSSDLSYPDYPRMYAPSEVNISYIVGPNSDKSKADDDGRMAFEKAFRLLVEGKNAVNHPDLKLEKGTHAYLKNLAAENDVRFTVVEQSTYARTLVATNRGISFFLFMYLIHPIEETPEFQGKIRNALKRSDVLIYDGHSGLGYNLNLFRLFNFDEETLAKDKYQIYFFNACSTFAYYNTKYFAQKKSEFDPNGTRNLDIVTTSIGALYNVAASTDFIFIHSLVNGSRPSWQKIMDDVYSIDPNASALTQVNGDEDNPRSPL